MTIDGC